MNTEKTNQFQSKPEFKRLGECLYWKGSRIVARVRVNGKLTWRSTGTDKPADARKWLEKWRKEEWMLQSGIEPKGVVLRRKRLPIGELIDEYLKAGCPTRKMQQKSPATITNELACLKPLRGYFGYLPATGVTLGDCDKYRDWRTSGGYFAGDADRERRKKFARMKTGNRSVDLELTILGNVFNLATRRGLLERNPLIGRSRYSRASEIRHCRETAPTPEGLKQVEHWLRVREEHAVADLFCFLAFSGLRIGEALPLDWEAVDWATKLIHVQREKRGILPWVPILPEMESLLQAMRKRASGHLLFPSPFEANAPRDDSAVRHRLTAACKALGLGHVTPHGLRSYFVTQARQSGLSDAEIAMLIGDKSGPAIIALTYGDVRPDHLFKQAQRIKLTVTKQEGQGASSSIASSNSLPDVSACFAERPHGFENGEVRR
jgi:integrase